MTPDPVTAAAELAGAAKDHLQEHYPAPPGSWWEVVWTDDPEQPTLVVHLFADRGSAPPADVWKAAEQGLDQPMAQLGYVETGDAGGSGGHMGPRGYVVGTWSTWKPAAPVEDPDTGAADPPGTPRCRCVIETTEEATEREAIGEAVIAHLNASHPAPKGEWWGVQWADGPTGGRELVVLLYAVRGATSGTRHDRAVDGLDPFMAQLGYVDAGRSGSMPITGHRVQGGDVVASYSHWTAPAEIPAWLVVLPVLPKVDGLPLVTRASVVRIPGMAPARRHLHWPPSGWRAAPDFDDHWRVNLSTRLGWLHALALTVGDGRALSALAEVLDRDPEPAHAWAMSLLNQAPSDAERLTLARALAYAHS